MSILQASEKFTTETEVKEFIKQAQKGNEFAMERIITANLPMIAKMANRYMRSGSSFDDLQSEGIIALMGAVRKFNLRGNTLVGTVFINAVNTAMRRFCGKDRAVRIGINANEVNRKINAIVERLKAEEVNITYELLAIECNLPIERIKKCLDIDLGVVSMNTKSESKEGESNEFGNSIASDENTPYEITANSDMITVMLSKMQELSDIERIVLEYYYGLNGKEKKTYGEIAEILNRSLEGVRIIEKKALKKMLTMLK